MTLSSCLLSYVQVYVYIQGVADTLQLVSVFLGDCPSSVQRTLIIANNNRRRETDCVCVCVCVCVRERERERAGGVCVCVCVC